MTQDAIRAIRAIAPSLVEQLDPRQYEAIERLLSSVVLPLSEDDVRELVSLLPADGDTAYGLNWTILHLIEAAPGWPHWEALQFQQGEWIDVLMRRLANAGISPPARPTRN
ncbi:hypothetical protein EN873_03690 [bacterium M00.F.Ca.ET.230.01.1.1]|nr:hypothetical protein EN873_03690 [bacterium M00.F.Ca.ET.230.01.1.1]